MFFGGGGGLAELGENLGRTDVGVWLDCSVIGDSIGAATHANNACVSDPDGTSTELMDCLESQLGSHDTNWSFMGGSRSWAIANRFASNSHQAKKGCLAVLLLPSNVRTAFRKEMSAMSSGCCGSRRSPMRA